MAGRLLLPLRMSLIRIASLLLSTLAVGALAAPAHAGGLMSSADRDAYVRAQNAQNARLADLQARVKRGENPMRTMVLSGAEQRFVADAMRSLKPATVQGRIARGENVLLDNSLTRNERGLATAIYREQKRAQNFTIAHDLTQRPPKGGKAPTTSEAYWGTHAAWMKHLGSR